MGFTSLGKMTNKEVFGLRKCTGCGKEEISSRTRHGYLKVIPSNDIGGSHRYEVLPCGEMVLKDRLPRGM